MLELSALGGIVGGGRKGQNGEGIRE
ncbi:hypothetical protein AVEN_58217-1, partial [Araneus ventricosus]